MFKNKKPYIKFVSTIKGLEQIEECLPKPALKYMPEWFKNTPSTHNGFKTVKVCPSFPDLFSSAYVVPMWQDSILNYDESTDRWETKGAGLTNWETHGNMQFIDHVGSSFQGVDGSFVFKTSCPWRIITPPGYSVLQLPMFYHFNKDWSTLMGIIDTDVHHEINQQILYHGDGKDVYIARGTPIAMYLPYKRNKFDFSTSFMTEEQQNRFNVNDLRFKGSIFSKPVYRTLQKEQKDE